MCIAQGVSTAWCYKFGIHQFLSQCHYYITVGEEWGGGGGGGGGGQGEVKRILLTKHAVVHMRLHRHDMQACAGTIRGNSL